MSLTKTEIDKLPTILDLIDELSVEENNRSLQRERNIPFDEHFDEGRYMVVGAGQYRELPMLMPMSPTPFTFFRGQNKYYSPSYASLFRQERTEDELAILRLKTAEFGRLLQSHYAYADLNRNFFVDYVAVAQHYGLETEFMDITNNKWIAAFFSTTRYDEQTKQYYPVGRDYEDGYGVLYVTKPNIEKTDFFKEQTVIGFCYFERPSRQFSFGYRMNGKEDFDRLHYFEKRFFRHDIDCSNIIFATTAHQNRVIPNDELSQLAEGIKKGNTVSELALKICVRDFYPNGEAFLRDVCRRNHITIGMEPTVKFANMEEEWKEWFNIGRVELQQHILPMYAVTTVKINK